MKVFYTSGVNLAALTPMLQGGAGGNPGDPGNPGHGGASGATGVTVAACTTTLGSQDGPAGDPCRSETGDQKGGVALIGNPGSNGQYTTFQIKAIPQVAGI